MVDGYARVYFRMIGLVFPSTKRLGVEIESCWREFFYLVKKIKIESEFGNS